MMRLLDFIGIGFAIIVLGWVFFIGPIVDMAYPHWDCPTQQGEDK